MENDRLFQFTPALRRATRTTMSRARVCVCFNSRPPCDGRRFQRTLFTLPSSFQFTPALRRATQGCRPASLRPKVSIHARLATGDISRAWSRSASRCFNSRPPCDGRPGPLSELCQLTQSFNSRPPCDGRQTVRIAVATFAKFQFTPALRRATATICSIIAVIKHLHASQL